MSKLPKFTGRREELRQLSQLERKKNASLVVIKGRRRIGKSRLAFEFGKGKRFYAFSGIPITATTTLKSQLEEFARQISQQFNIPSPRADDWGDVFLLLAKLTEKEKVVILLDEISWMGSKDSDFLGKLKNAWDLYFSQNPGTIMLLCGSISSWIDKNILSATGFVGRISLTLTLKELPLHDCAKFWDGQGSHISSYEMLKVLAVTGGVPKYLEEIHPSISAEENIKALCFESSGILFNEFEQIFSDLFLARAEIYKKIIAALANGPLEFNSVCQQIGLAKSGLVSEYLDDLALAGFISRDFTWKIKTGVESALSHYRLSDNYLRFYLKYVQKNRNRISQGQYAHRSLASLPGWDSIMGLQIENLVLNNRHKLHELLSIPQEQIIACNPFFQRKTKTQDGCQIDYLIQTQYNSLCICEIKATKNHISTSIIDEVQQKINRLKLPKNFTYRPVLIYAGELDPRVAEANYFAALIDMADFFEK